MSEKPVVLPEFPESGEPRRRRPSWWKRAFRPLGAFGKRLGAWFSPETNVRRRSSWWKRGLRSIWDFWARMIGSVVDFVVLILGWIWGSLEGYLRGRQFLRLLYGLPALIVLLGAGVMGAMVVNAARYDVGPAYRKRAQQAFLDRNFELAQVCYLRVIQEDKAQPADMFSLYQTLRALKHDDQADALLVQLTPLDGNGYAPAHLAMAKRMLIAIGPDTSADGRRRLGLAVEARRHLEKALVLQPDYAEAHGLLGQMYFAVGNWKQADQHLKLAVQKEPELAARLMVTAERLGNRDESRMWADRARQTYQSELIKDPKNVVSRVSLVQILMKLQDFEAATKFVQEGMEVTPKGDWPILQSQVYAAQVLALPKDKTPAELATRWTLIERGIQLDPNNLALLTQLLDVTHGTDVTAEQARGRLRTLLAEGQSSAVLHLVLGMDAYSQGKIEQARFHWERAFDLDKRMLFVGNNVAWLMAHEQPGSKNRESLLLACGLQAGLIPDPRQPENLKRALELIDYVLKQAPENPNPSFYETRGQILAKMGRWKECIADLEKALPRLSNKGPIHATLAKAYQELGLPELAEQHRKLALQPPPKSGERP